MNKSQKIVVIFYFSMIQHQTALADRHPVVEAK